MRDHVELQHADRAENQVVVGQRAEQLGGAFLAQLGQALEQRFHFQRILELRAAEQFGAKLGMPVKASCSPWVKLSPMRIVPWL